MMMDSIVYNSNMLHEDDDDVIVTNDENETNKCIAALEVMKIPTFLVLRKKCV